ncbi:DUF1214 domain-containing protein [Vibrio sp. ZSDZ34]|uniref:DUF1214 domain-containing protein n=1 Tax=Vibrio gelatinilyticus TaxID=2893468 RepID=A0A9X1WFH1_9VIBR|nr:DUF1214 domain-containing protein [Vibrio gelatinilyticus]MCJ2377460.1 DUF1214 domain-containing protein [Vibrio gelatinilyticus]
MSELNIMKKSMITLALATAAFTSIASEVPSGYPVLNSEEVYQQMDLENLTRAFVDLQPEAAFMSLYHSYFDAGSTEQNIGIMETSVDPRQIVLTANSETVYAVHPVNLEVQGGAVVLEVPPGVMGMANGPGWTSFADFGLTGSDRGKGGTYLLTAPGWEGEVPSDMIHAPSPTNTIVWLIRAFQGKEGMPGAVNTLTNGLKTYSLADANEPPKTTFYNTSAPVYDDGGYQDMLFHKKDIPALIQQYYLLNGYDAEKHSYNTAHLYHAGFFNNSIDEDLLKEAKDLAWERVLTLTFSNREHNAYKWGQEQSHWVLPNTTADENWTHRDFDIVDPVAQVVWAHQATFTAAAMTRPPRGTGAVYVSTYVDSDGNYLNGSNCYQLDIPAGVPYSNFWSLVTYNAPERSMIQNDHFTWGINSYQEGLEQNTDGSYSIYWGPNVDNNENSIQTNFNEGFFPYFRIYGPTDTWYDNSWVIPNIERVECSEYK